MSFVGRYGGVVRRHPGGKGVGRGCCCIPCECPCSSEDWPNGCATLLNEYALTDCLYEGYYYDGGWIYFGIRKKAGSDALVIPAVAAHPCNWSVDPVPDFQFRNSPEGTWIDDDGSVVREVELLHWRCSYRLIVWLANDVAASFYIPYPTQNPVSDAYTPAQDEGSFPTDPPAPNTGSATIS